MTPERIERFAQTWKHDPEAQEIARLALLGLKVEEAPTTVCAEWTEVIGRPPFDSYTMVGRCPCPLELAGKRVALVVLP